MVEIRHRVLLEPRGFIRLIEFVLAIVVFATTGGYSGTGTGTLKCVGDGKVEPFTITISYPFNLQGTKQNVLKCNGNETVAVEAALKGDFSPTSQWFVFVAVMAFLICIASIVFYVAFESEIRQAKEFMVTVTDLVVTVIWAFLWLTAAASWAWGVDQVKTYSDPADVCDLDEVKPLPTDSTCRSISSIDYTSLNASVAFAFLSFVVWVANVWFVYKETPYHDDGQPPPTNPPTQH